MKRFLTIVKKLYPLFVIVGLLLPACSGQQSDSRPTPTPLPTPIIPIKPTYIVKRGEVVSKLDFNGKILPVVMQELYFRAAGRVDGINIGTAEQVKIGQILAQLDTGPSAYELRRAQANLEIAQLNRALASRQDSTDVEMSRILLAIKEKEVELAQIDLDELNDAVAAGQIIAPFDGTVLSISTAEGAIVEAFNPVMVVADLSDLEISSDLRLDDLAKVIQDALVTVSAVARNIPETHGTVRTLPLDPGTTGGNIRIALETQPGEMGYKVGDTVSLSLLLEKKDDALWLPPQAIRNFNGNRFVIIQDAEGQRRVDITTGIESEDRVEILSGLNEGDVIIAP